MFNYAFANYESKVYVDKHSDVGEAQVVGGKEKTVKLAAVDKLTAFGKKGNVDYTVEYEIDASVKAPVKQGDIVGRAKLVDANGTVVKEVAITVQNNVDAKTYWDYVKDITTNN